MEKEAQEPKYNYIVNQSISSLNVFKRLRALANKLVVFEDLEVEPYDKFSIGFQADYWFIKYHLFRDGRMDLDNDFEFFFDEEDVNIVWLKITDEETFILSCRDGIWFIDFFYLDNKIFDFFKNMISEVKVND
ncbi:hypothetical protein ACFFGT_08435 [Mucilaginibacter angelicae]|uniref:Uncharacterized protein n=1 Tax=Mucilaginibacter angelicae TaxID=869718 RepID=A0ABV6L428_9SPHI